MSGKTWPFGKHKWRTIEEVILCYPDYINWWSKQPPNDQFQWLDDYIDEKIVIFDAKPFINAKCAGKVNGITCTRPVSLATFYEGSCSPAFRCDECNVLQLGASSGKLNEVTTYDWALLHARCCGRPWTAQRFIIKELAIAKGLKKPWTQKKMFEFLNVL